MQFGRIIGAVFFLIVSCIGSTAQNTSQVPLTPETARAITDAIQSVGYNCPLAKMSFAEGQDAYGTVSRVYCGPADRDGVFENAVFRLTFLPSGRLTVEPWADR